MISVARRLCELVGCRQMKKPARKAPSPVRPLQPVDLDRVRGGITAMDDWEAPITSGNKRWDDDWLAPK